MTREAYDTALREALHQAARDPAAVADLGDSSLDAYDLTEGERAALGRAVRGFAQGLEAMRAIGPTAYRGAPWPFSGMTLGELLALGDAAERVAVSRNPGDRWPSGSTIVRDWADALLLELQTRRLAAVRGERSALEATEVKVRLLRDRS